jgi:hypothetical protein
MRRGIDIGSTAICVKWGTDRVFIIAPFNGERGIGRGTVTHLEEIA